MILVAGRCPGKPLSAVIFCVFMAGIKALIKVVRTAKGTPCFAKITHQVRLTHIYSPWIFDVMD
jgi:hypothetical protein